MASLNLDRTKAILIGSSYFSCDFKSIPNVTNNIDDFKSIIIDNGIIGIPENNIIELCNEPHDKVFEKINTILENPDIESIILYYAGHGYRTIHNNLYLTTNNSKKRTIKYTSIPFTDLQQILEKSQIQHRIFILDACFSGLATQSDSTGLTEIEREIKGTYILASSPFNEKSYFHEEHRNTLFSGNLFSILKSGSEEKFEYLSLDFIFEKISKQMMDIGMPCPQKKDNLNTSSFAFIKNTIYTTPKTECVENIISSDPSEELPYFKISSHEIDEFNLIKEKAIKHIYWHIEKEIDKTDTYIKNAKKVTKFILLSEITIMIIVSFFAFGWITLMFWGIIFLISIFVHMFIDFYISGILGNNTIQTYYYQRDEVDGVCATCILQCTYHDALIRVKNTKKEFGWKIPGFKFQLTTNVSNSPNKFLWGYIANDDNIAQNISNFRYDFVSDISDRRGTVYIDNQWKKIVYE